MSSRSSESVLAAKETVRPNARFAVWHVFTVDALLCAILFLSVVALYWPARSFSWIAFDDPEVVFFNPHTLRGLNWHTFRWAFRSYTGALWQPLTMLSFLLDVRLFGPSPGPMHLENVLLHGLSAAGWYVLWKGMTRQTIPAFFVAAYFAVHPAHIESVAWITERKDVLSMLMLVISLICYWRYTLEYSWGAYVASVIFCALALLSKPMMVTLPVLLVLMDLWPLGRTRWWHNASVIDQAPAVGLLRLIFEKIPFAALALGASIVALLSQSSAGAMAGLGGRPISDRIATAILGYVRYLGTAFWPRNLSIFYPYQSNMPAATVFAAALLLGLITAFAVRLRKRQPYLLAGWIWYLVTLVPVIGIVQVGSQSMADRYTYLPFVGLSVAIIWTVTNFVNRRSYSGMIAILAGSAGLVGCIIVSRIYLSCWANTLTLFGEAANLYPSDATIEAELGEGYRFANRPDQAIEHYDRSLQLNPNQFTAHTNLANLLLPYFPEMALPHYREAIRIIPASSKAHYNYALCLEKLKQNDAAQAEFAKAKQLKRD